MELQAGDLVAGRYRVERDERGIAPDVVIAWDASPVLAVAAEAAPGAMRLRRRFKNPWIANATARKRHGKSASIITPPSTTYR